MPIGLYRIRAGLRDARVQCTQLQVMRGADVGLERARQAWSPTIAGSTISGRSTCTPRPLSAKPNA